MHIEEIQIQNFKGLRKEVFEPSTFSCLVGENNTGKSTVLQALAFSLRLDNKVPIEEYYDDSVPVEFQVCFGGIEEADLARLQEKHRDKISPLVEEKSFRLVLRYPPGEKVEVKVLKTMPRDPRLREDAIAEVFKGRKGRPALLEAVDKILPGCSANLPADATTIGAATAYVQSRIDSLPPEEFELAEAPLPSGMKESIPNFLPEPIYIPAVKNLGDDMKTTQSTSFGRLLGLLLEDLQPDLGTFTDALEELREKLNVLVDDKGTPVDNRHVRVKELERQIETLLRENFPAVKVRLEIPPPELKAILDSAKIWVDDGSLDLIDKKGDGVKRSMTFALLRAFVAQHRTRRQASEEEQGDEAVVPTPRPLCFLFEEPELYLHPKSQRILFDTLETIAADHQVVVTTHSPLFFAPGATAHFVRVAKEAANPKPIGVLRSVNFSLEPDRADTFKLARFEHADTGFFCSKVVLFEGESDDFFLSHLSKTIDPEWNFDRKNIGLVRVGGKGLFAKFRGFFEAFGIDVRVVADLDALFDGFEHLCSSTACAATRAKCIEEIDRRAAEVGIEPEPNAKKIKDKFGVNHRRDAFQLAKEKFSEAKEAGTYPSDAMECLEALFSWQDDETRVRAVCTDQECRVAVLPLLDDLRKQGIYVLSRGPIEAYYPEGVEGRSKPEKALSATNLVVSREKALSLSAPLGDGRKTELEEIFQGIFADL